MVENSKIRTRRILALWLPRLSTDRLRRKSKASGRPDDRPLVVAEKTENAIRLSAVDARAARLGLSTGMALADARARIPDIAVVPANAAKDAKLLASIADWCERYTPLVALDSPDGLLFDITGAAHLFGGEAALLQTIRDAISKQGFAVGIAIAGTSVAARALARFAHGTIVPAGGEAGALASLPVESLGADHAITHALKRAGLKTLGQLTTRGREELTARFGADFRFLLDCALGKAQSPITPRRALPDLLAERRFADPVVTDAVIHESLISLTKSLASVLERRGEGARAFEATFFRADGVTRRLMIETADAIRDPAIAGRLFREKLDALADPLDPGFGFDLIRLSAHGLQRLEARAAAFNEETSEKEIRFLIDCLSTRFGAQRVLRFQPQDTHVPEAEVITLPAQYTPLDKTEYRSCSETPRRPLRLFARPEPIEVMAEVPDGPPVHFRWRRALHRVVLAEGPERIALEWWRGQTSKPTRDYYRVEDDQGRRFWLYRDGIYAREVTEPRWFVHGAFA